MMIFVSTEFDTCVLGEGLKTSEHKSKLPDDNQGEHTVMVRTARAVSCP